MANRLSAIGAVDFPADLEAFASAAVKSPSPPVGFRHATGHERGLRRTRKRPRGLLRPLRGSLRSANPTLRAGASRGLRENGSLKAEGLPGCNCRALVPSVLYVPFIP